MFLEQRFSLVIYHYLNYKKEKKQYKKLVKKHGRKLLKILEEIAKEAIFTYYREKTKTRKFILEMIKTKNYDVYDLAIRYVKSFY